MRQAFTPFATFLPFRIATSAELLLNTSAILLSRFTVIAAASWTALATVNLTARVSTSTDGSSTRPRTARTAWIGASHCTTWYASRGNQYRTGTSSTLLKVANIVDFD